MEGYPMEKHGIDQLEKVIVITVTIANTAGVVLEDGKVGFGDIGALLKLGQVADLFAEVDFAATLPQAADLSAEELAKLKVSLVKLDLPNDLVEQKIEALILGAGEFYLAVKKLVGLVKAVAA
jgi:hypothetical protein